ncbi:MAG: hypothetical protein GTO02_10200, partial [Candidatus Dadabacteria bacterium]|nr:hypothetical protein [Candidatus Dadabacteria bacterium]
MKIVDSNGQKITEMNNLFAEAGIDNQVISFPKSGPYNLIIDINGIEGEIDSASGKTASLIFTVVPEFP